MCGLLKPKMIFMTSIALSSFSSLVETPMFKGELKCFELNLETTLISLKSTWEILHKR